MSDYKLALDALEKIRGDKAEHFDGLSKLLVSACKRAAAWDARSDPYEDWREDDRDFIEFGFPPWSRPALSLGEHKMKVEMKTGGYAIYDAPPALRKFLQARASGTASKELLAQLSAEALAEQEAERARMPEPRSNLDDVVIDFNRARAERIVDKNAPSETLC